MESDNVAEFLCSIVQVFFCIPISFDTPTIWLNRVAKKMFYAQYELIFFLLCLLFLTTTLFLNMLHNCLKIIK